jgi:hypothetical protein
MPVLFLSIPLLCTHCSNDASHTTGIVRTYDGNAALRASHMFNSTVRSFARTHTWIGRRQTAPRVEPQTYYEEQERA